ncbi:MAG: hypothetical protein OEZ08_06205 [Betaproteobacteria bacterium]|nr:hypothetical protein [Betaproteobacteria bacterium]
MTDKSVDDPRQLAAEIGLEHAAQDVLEQLPLAAATARKHRSALKAFELAPEDEPAVVFTLGELRSR